VNMVMYLEIYILGTSWVAEQLMALQEVLSSVEWFGWLIGCLVNWIILKGEMIK
jgi:hypothetical protein